MNPESIREQALLYASGELSPEERDAFEALLAAGDPIATAEAEAFLDIAEALLPPAPPPPGFRVLRQTQNQARPTPYPGVTVEVLHLDRKARTVTTILALEPGAEYPSHRHSIAEQCLVLSGDVWSGSLELTAGDFQVAAPGSTHNVISTRGGCRLLMISGIHDEILA
ncbi:MAG: cupin domain-containing protein [Acidobacteria bacterium]|nr:cupin domain-containing protein [Acidobacteriota bacterium]